MGSRAGSSSSAMFSNKHGFPNRTAFSKLLRKSLSDSLMTSRPASFSCNGCEKQVSLKARLLVAFSMFFPSSYHVFDPFVGLSLWVDEQRPASRELDDNTVFNTQVVLGQTCDLPTPDLDWFAQGRNEVTRVIVWNV